MNRASLPQALIRATPEDFEVIEIPKVEASGSGEHLLVHVRKRNANTVWVAEQLARWARVSPRSVSWAGLKDRRAVTEQWFSVHCIGRDPDPAQLDAEGVTVLSVTRHERKLRRGTLHGNRFRIVLRELGGSAPGLETNVQALVTGFPNRFGVQRFGRDGRNVALAERWFSGGLPPRNRNQRGFMISAARSLLFNAVLDLRVRERLWDQPVEGDMMVHDGRGSRFAVESVDDGIITRCRAGEIHPTGPMWGRGRPEVSARAAELELEATAALATLRAGLEAVADMDRRPLRVIPGGLRANALDGDTLELVFELPPGAYATTLLDCIVDWREPDGIEGESDAGED